MVSERSIDFERIAAHVIDAGLFAVDPTAARKNLLTIEQYRKHPVTLLDVPYEHGPTAVEVWHRDVPETSIYAVRHNFTEANKLLVPEDDVSSYFEARILADDLLTSPSLETLVASYQAPAIDQYEATGNNRLSGIRYQPDELSFRVTGVDRMTHDRFLYTREEHVAGLRLADRFPAVVLAILFYQSVVQDYLQGVRAALVRIAQRPDSHVTAKDITDFDGYMEPWRASNFTHELIPAIALFQQQRLDAGAVEERSIDRGVFQSATGFIIENGAFRNWITIPADLATDHQERVYHFLCPAVGAVRAQLSDGLLLWRLYGIARQKIRRKDRNGTRYAERIRAEAREKFQNRDQAPFTVTINGEARPLQINTSFVLLMRGRPQPGDLRIQAPASLGLFDAMRSAVSLAIARDAAICFDFGGTGYRITPQGIAEFMNQAARRV